MKKLLTHPFLWLQIICFGILYFTLQKFLLHPNTYIFNQWGDGIKNYFTPAWYIQYDSGTHFSGMAYPFGEHVVYTDDQPALSWVLNFIDDHIIPVSQYTVGIMNMLMLLSLVFCAMLMYKILVHYRIPPWWAVAASVIITFMNPQMQRIDGHYALSYCFYIPLLWWLSICVKRKKYPALSISLLIIVITIFGFIHLYYAFIGILFFTTHLFILLFKKITNRKEVFSHIFIIVIPFLFIYSFLQFTDTVSDRTSAPYGFFSYEASIQSVFLPREGNFADYIYKNTTLRKGDSEGYAYVGGMAAIIAVISFFTYIIRSAKNKTFKTKIIEVPGDLSVYIIAAIISLLFSFAFPFNLGLQWLIDYIPFIGQFRSLGRFAWIFYYVFTVYAVVYVYSIFLKINLSKKITSYLFSFLMFVFALYETKVIFIYNCNLINSTAFQNPFQPFATFWEDRLAENGYSVNDFQATLFTGFFLNGSEKLYIDRSSFDSGRAMEIAYQTGLPIINSMLSRTSVSETLQLAQVVSHAAIKKTYPSLISKKDILLISNEKNLIKQEKFLLTQSKLICQVGDLKLYALPISAFDDTQHVLQDSFRKSKQAYYFDSSYHYYSEKPIQLFYENNFEEYPSPETFEGKGSYYKDRGGDIIAEIPVNISEVIWIEISYWAKTYMETTAYPNIKVKFQDAQGEIIKEAGVNPKYSTDIIGDWVRAAENFDVPVSCKKIVLQVSKDKKVNFDNLLVRHTAYDVYYDILNDSSFTFNNYPIGK